MTSLDFQDYDLLPQGNESPLKQFFRALGKCLCCRGSAGVLFADKVLRSTGYLIVLAIVFVLVLTLFIWGLVDHSAMDSTGYIVLDALVTFELLCELVIKLIAQHPKPFIKSAWNIFDLAVFVLCLVGFIINIVLTGEPGIGEYIVDALLIVRVVIVGVRLIRIIKEGANRLRDRVIMNRVCLENEPPSALTSDTPLDP